MSYKDNRAGKSTRNMADKRRRSALWTGLFGIAVVVVLWLLLQNSKEVGIRGISILILLVLLRVVPGFFEGRIDRKLKEEKRAIRGAKAEEKIGELLAELSDEYHVMNDVESPYGNIDHIVIGKNGGIFLIETKAHGGRVETAGETLLVNGKPAEKDFISQALRNSYWLRDTVGRIVGSKPWITPVIVFTNAFVSSTNPIKGVRIVNRKYLLGVLHKANRVNAVNTQVWELRKEIEISLM